MDWLTQQDPKATWKEFKNHADALEWTRGRAAVQALTPVLHIGIVGGNSAVPIVVDSWQALAHEILGQGDKAKFKVFRYREDARDWAIASAPALRLCT